MGSGGPAVDTTLSPRVKARRSHAGIDRACFTPRSRATGFETGSCPCGATGLVQEEGPLDRERASTPGPNPHLVLGLDHERLRAA